MLYRRRRDQPTRAENLSDDSVLVISGIDVSHNDVKQGFQDNTRNLIGSATMKVLFKPIKFCLTSRFPRLTSL